MSWSTIADTRLDTLLREIGAAFIERGLAGTGDLVAAGTNIQSAALYAETDSRFLYNRGWQARIEGAIAGGFEDFTNRFVHKDTILNSGETDFEYYTLTTFAAAAGLQYPDLWRRKTAMGDAFSYGKMQEGDIIGPWIIEDLQKALSALLRWGRAGIVGADDYHDFPVVRNGEAEFEDTLADAKAAALAAWNAAGYTDIPSSPAEWPGGYAELSSYGGYSFGARVYHAVYCMKAALDGSDYPLGATIRAYFKGDAVKKGNDFNAFGDVGVVEGTGTTQMRFVKILTYPTDVLAIGTREGLPLHGIDVIPSWPSDPPTPTSGTSHGYQVELSAVGGFYPRIQLLIEPVLAYG